MNKYIYLFSLLLVTFILLASNLNATSIIAPKNIGEMQKLADAVIYATAIEKSNNVVSFELLQNIKSEEKFNSHFDISNYSGTSNGMDYVVFGDADFEVGKNYLLFLNKNGFGKYQLSLLAFSLFEEVLLNGEKVFSQVKEAAQLETFSIDENHESNSFGVFKRTALLNYLKEKASNQTLKFDPKKAGQIENIDINDLLENTINYEVMSRICGDPLPAHCTYLFTNQPEGRFVSMPLNVMISNNDGTYIANNDSEYPGTDEYNALTSACSILTSNYPGVTYAYNGLYSGFYPLSNSCNSGSGTAQGNLNSHFGSDCNSLLVFFEDPCSQITDVTSTGGVLGIGGCFTYGTALTHTDICGKVWSNLCTPFLVLNNGIYSNYGSVIYSKVLQHELTHCIGLGHIDGSFGSALMNASLNANTNIVSLDVDCVDYMYNPELPVSCETPQTIIVTNINETNATITWSPTSNANNYQINYRPLGSFSWTPTISSFNFAVLNNLDNCTDYEFRIRANCADGSSSSFSPTAYLTTDCVILCPQLLNLTSINPTNQSILLNWDLVAGANYTLYTRVQGNTTWFTNSLSFPFAILFTLQECTTYEWYIEVNCDNNEISEPSNVQNFSTTGC